MVRRSSCRRAGCKTYTPGQGFFRLYTSSVRPSPFFVSNLSGRSFPSVRQTRSSSLPTSPQMAFGVLALGRLVALSDRAGARVLQVHSEYPLVRPHHLERPAVLRPAGQASPQVHPVGSGLGVEFGPPARTGRATSLRPPPRRPPATSRSVCLARRRPSDHPRPRGRKHRVSTPMRGLPS